jgi:hypothetical protein
MSTELIGKDINTSVHDFAGKDEGQGENRLSRPATSKANVRDMLENETLKSSTPTVHTEGGRELNRDAAGSADLNYKLSSNDEIRKSQTLMKEDEKSEEAKENLAEVPAESTPVENQNPSDEEEKSLAESSSQEEYFKMIKEVVMADRSTAPLSYTTNSPKEEVIITFVENFLRQYKQIYPHRRDLFILLKNEFEVKKFVCQTIRPTQLRFKELYDYKEAARFVADYLSYDLLDPPYEIVSTKFHFNSAKHFAFTYLYA